MKIKKILAGIFPSVLAAAVLTACSPKHTHAPAEGWELNAKEHWQLCECGEAMNTAAHTLDENSLCSVCGAEIWDFGDSVDVHTYTQYGDPLRSTSYDADGSITSDLRYEYEYDADGNKLLEKYYGDGVLMEETVYEAGIPVQYTAYYEDGTKTVAEYDENGNIPHSVYYDVDGSVASETWSEFASTADGDSYESKNTMTDADGIKYIGEYNEQGDMTAWLCYDADGSLMTEERYEFEYDTEGRKQVKRSYVNGTLTEELIYTLVTEEDGWMNYPGTVIAYEADGSKTVTEYNENDEIISKMTYDAAGNAVE